MFLIRLRKIIWASPYTMLSLMIGLVGLCNRGRVLRRWPLEFCDGGVGWFLSHLPSDYFMAMTLKLIQTARPSAAPNSVQMSFLTEVFYSLPEKCLGK